MAGTGLPIPKDNPVLAQAAGGVSGDALFNAESWNRIGSAGERLANLGADALKVSEHKAQVGYLADQDVAIQRRQIELRNEYAHDPQGFDNAWKAFSDKTQAEVQPWAVNHVRAKLGASGNGAYSAILNETRVQGDKNAEASWKALEDMASNDVTGHAMAGTLNSPAGQAAIEKYRGVVRTGVTSQFIVPEQAEQRMGTLESLATVYASRAGVKATFDADGPIGAIKQIDEITRDQSLKLSPEQRVTLGARLRADVHAWDAERTKNVATVDLAAQSLIKAQQGGIAIPQSKIDETVDQYKRFGAPAQAAKFLSDMQHSAQLSFLSRVPSSEGAAWVNQYATARGFNAPPQAAKTAVDYFVSQGWTPAQAQGIVGNLIHESGLNPSAVHDNNTGLGIAGHRLERLTAMREFARERGKPVTDFQTQLEFIQKELNSNESATGIRLRNSATPEQAAAAFIHFERPQGYDPADVTKAHGYSNRVGQAIRLAGGTVPTTPSDVAFLGKANEIVSKKVSDDADAMVKQMASGVLPTEKAMSDLLSAAAATNTPEVLDKVTQAAGEYQFRRQFGRAPEPQEAGVVSAMEQKARTEGLSVTDARRLDIARQIHEETAKALQDDPLNHTFKALAETAQMPVPAPLNVQNSPQFTAGLQARAQWAATGAQTFEMTAMPALTSNEAAQVRAALDASDAAGKARIYRDIVTALPGNIRAATLQKLGTKGVDGMVEVFAGGMTGADPAIGESILRGQQAMKLKDNFNPMGSGNKENTNAALDKYLPPGAFSLAARTDPQGQYATIRAAALARAADLAATDPNFKGDFTDAMMQRAVNDVTGGIVTHNGGSLITPIRGMNQRQFDARIAGLSDLDLQGVMTQNGTPITADYVRGSAQLESLSDGRYLVRLGRDPERPIYAFRDLGAGVAGRMRPFILDLRAVSPSTSAAAMPIGPDPIKSPFVAATANYGGPGE